MEIGSGLFFEAAQGCLRKRSGLFFKAAQGCLWEMLRAVVLKPLRAVYGNTLRAVYENASGLFRVNSGVD
jgi:hypothetical protein